MCRSVNTLANFSAMNRPLWILYLALEISDAPAYWLRARGAQWPMRGAGHRAACGSRQFVRQSPKVRPTARRRIGRSCPALRHQLLLVLVWRRERARRGCCHKSQPPPPPNAAKGVSKQSAQQGWSAASTARSKHRAQAQSAASTERSQQCRLSRAACQPLLPRRGHLPLIRP